MPTKIEKDLKKTEKELKRTGKDLMREYHDMLILSRLLGRFNKEEGKKKERLEKSVKREVRRLNKDERYFDKDVAHLIGEFHSLCEELEDHFEEKSKSRDIISAVEPFMDQLTRYKGKLLAELAKGGKLSDAFNSEDLQNVKDMVDEILDDIKGAYRDEEHLSKVIEHIEVKISESSGEAKVDSDDYRLGDSMIRKYDYPRKIVNHVFSFITEEELNKGIKPKPGKSQKSIGGWNPEVVNVNSIESEFGSKEGEIRIPVEIIGKSRYNMKPIATKKKGERRQYNGMHSSSVEIPTSDLRKVSNKEMDYYKGLSKEIYGAA